MEHISNLFLQKCFVISPEALYKASLSVVLSKENASLSDKCPPDRTLSFNFLIIFFYKKKTGNYVIDSSLRSLFGIIENKYNKEYRLMG